jgi:ABC-type branched-subunit amino acid transport system substrate-binding protein
VRANNAVRPVGRRRTAGLISVASATAVVTLLSACGRSSTTPTSGPVPVTAASSASVSAPASAGTFGSLKDICGPGDAKGATAKGVTAGEIHIGVTADPGAASLPGLGQEFFDVGDAFTTWCNAAGGINGRKIVLDKYDAKLFEGAAQIINACQKDFMLVGNGNAFDGPTVKPRLGCKLAQIPAYTVSPEATKAGLQVQASPNPANEYEIGAYRLLAEKFPAALKGIGIGSSNYASLTPTGDRLRDALQQVGYKVTALQEKPPLVDNFRPYMEQLKSSNSVAYTEFVNQDLTPEIQAMNNVGYSPVFLAQGYQYYDQKTIKAAQSASFPPTWVYFNHIPFELSDQFPVMSQLKSIMTASTPSPKLTDFTMLAFDAWTLWAQSATQCGSTLTSACVLAKAGVHTDWTAGGLFPPRDTNPSNPHQSRCLVMVKVTTGGFVYDKDVTKPNNGIYNCDDSNVVKLKNTYGG